MDKCEIIERLKNIAEHAVYTVGEEPFVMSLDDGIAVHEAIELLKKPETNCSEIPNNWIPCSERLPQQGQEVICQCRANIIKVLKLDANGDWYQDAEHCYMGGFVIAWMPLPEPYQEGGAE